ncbi:MAG: rod shape-determining protein [Lachnospirales bacterium]
MSTDIGIDLGTANVLVFMKGKGVVLCEPSVVAIKEGSEEIIAIGQEAREMIGRSHGGIKVIRPLRGGVISDFRVTEIMLKHFIKKVMRSTRLIKPRIAVCVPSKITSVERRAVIDATKQAGAKEVYLIEEPLAGAIGSGIDISQPLGSMIVDIGGGTTDVAVISLGGTVVSHSIKIAGDDFDEAIIRYVRKKHNLLIGERSAEMLKIQVGTLYPDGRNNSLEIKGRSVLDGLPSSIIITENDMYEAMIEVAEQLVQVIKTVFEETPPELAGDVYDRGIVLTGGGSMLYGLDKLIKFNTGIDAYIPEDPLFRVVIGTGRFVENIDEYSYIDKVN